MVTIIKQVEAPMDGSFYLYSGIIIVYPIIIYIRPLADVNVSHHIKSMREKDKKG